MSQMPQRSQRFLEALRERVLIGDGAMGTQLYERGVSLDASFEHLNLVRPELVRAVHADYLAAGAEVIETNSFAANRLRLGAIGLAHRVGEINRAAARLARESAGDSRFVAGSVGPLTRARSEAEELSGAEKLAAYREQMTALAEGGVDLFLLETFADLDDLERALVVAGEVGLPAVAQAAFLEGGRTVLGWTVEEFARRLGPGPAVALGANCGAGPKGVLELVARLAQVSDRPLSAFPNAGLPDYHDGRVIYLATPDYFARRGCELVAAGARLVGGCCGTGPAHIRALAAALAGEQPQPRVSVAVSAHPVPPPSRPAHPDRGFLAGWGRRPIISVELDPPRGLEHRRVVAAAVELARAGVDVLSIAENPLARVRMGNIALAQRLQQETGLPVIVHITGRDRNLLALHSDLMGAHLLGIRNLLLVTGDPVAVGGEAAASNVFDLNSVGLLELVAALNAGRTTFGTELGGHTEFLAGAAFNPHPAALAGQLRKLERKVAAGARFVQTQPVYAADEVRTMLARTAHLELPILVGLLPLVSGRNAEFLHNEVPGIVLPEAVRERMAGKEGDAGVREGLAIVRELVAELRAEVGGWYLMPPFGRVGVALELVAAIRGGAE